MSQITKNNASASLALLLMTGLFLLLSACGNSNPNPKATFNAANQKHAEAWLPAGHMAAAQKNQAACAECHGSDLLGGISQVSCTRCHLGGVDSAHPKDWAQEQIWSKHKAYVAGIGTSACSNAACHGDDLNGVATSGPSCTSCHLDGVNSKHPQAWGEHAAFLHQTFTLDNGGGKCANAACHGTTLSGVAGSGPACSKCHAAPSHGVLNSFSAPCASCHTDALNIDTNRMMHPFDPKTAPTASAHASYAKTTGTASCAVAACHGTELKGGANANCPSCESCHLGGVDKVHPVEWGAAIIQQHQTYVAANSTAGCANAACHGPNLTGGASSAPPCTKCHVGGVITISKHPFADPAVVNHKAYVAANGTGACALLACHGPGLTGAGNAPSCVTACHLGDATTKHPASFGTTTTEVALNHKAFIALNAVSGADGMDGCRNVYCHGASLNGAAPAIGPSCSTTACHQIGTPAVLANCASCHGRPPTGTAAPNREGAHAEHNALAGVANVCDTCHGGAGTGTVNHFNGAVNVQVLNNFSASGGAATYVGVDRKCSNVSCHGGQITPEWLTETIDVNLSTGCVKCHEVGPSAGTPQYNSPYSGRHSFHVTGEGIGCTSCHNPAIPNHFATLAPPLEMEGNAAATIGSVLINAYDPSGNKSCAALCHVAEGIPETQNWLP